MKVTAPLAFLVVLFVVCSLLPNCFGQSNNDTTTITPSPTSGTGLKHIAFLYYGVISDLGWTFAHDQARLAVQQKYRGKVRTEYRENVLTTADTIVAFDHFIGRGFDLLVATSFDMMDTVIDYAGRYPNVSFVHVSGYKDAPNAAYCYARVYQAYYLGGMLAAHMTKGDLAGFVASFPDPSVLADINAFTIGFRKVKPTGRVVLSMAATWYDPFTEKKNAELLIQRYPNIQVFGQEVDSVSIPLVARDAGLYSVGYTTDMRIFAGESVLASTMFNFAPVYFPYVESVLNGSWLGKNLYPGLETGATSLSALSLNVPDDILEMIDKELSLLQSGNDTIFCGSEIQSLHQFNNTGDCLQDDEILGMVGYVDGIIFEGTFPKTYFVNQQYVRWGSGISIVFATLASLGIFFTRTLR
eukprot:TRINITY_DN1374_c0_g3_i1.p1 TRINITY_DN1374_c0_g3~~TRINITY_DN1374_c0_g3_i1.p1  ORF type:complete len:413 (-),score=95.88 TRINITY_DN1374_c0_g3_i1:4-1242(-)